MNCYSQKTKLFYRLTLLSVFFAWFILFPSYAVWASEINSENVIKLVNEARQAAGLEELKENKELMLAAQDKAWDMILNNYFAHTSPSGVSPWHWVEKYGYNYSRAGENLAMNFTNAENEQLAWMKSEKHRQNILNADYQEIGVAVKQGVIKGQMTTIAVQMFGAKVKGASSEIPSRDVASQEQPVKNFSRANNLPLNINPPDIKSLVAQYNIPENKAADVPIDSPQAVLYRNQEVLGKFAWAVAILVLLLVMAINSVTLVRMRERSASAVINAAILIIMLTAIVIGKM